MSTPSWIRNLFARTPRTIRKAPARFRPRFESLEDRVTPAVYIVDNATDNLNPGSLRWAITQANANPGPDIINNVINEGVQGQTTVLYPINLTLSGTPLPNITGDLTIRGHNQFTVSGNNQVRVLTINSGVTVQLNGMTLTSGNGNSGNKLGGAIFNQGTLSIVSSTISASDAGSGGGIYNSGTLSISNSTLSNNLADTGGAIFNQGTLSITGSTISGNLAGTNSVGGVGGGRTSNVVAQGGGIFSFDGSVTLDHVTLENNIARAGTNSQGNGFGAEGGGLYVAGGSTTILDSTVRANKALGGDGRVGVTGAAGTISGTVINGQTGGNGQPGLPGGMGGAGSGGGVFVQDATTSGRLIVFRSTISGNIAEGGAAGAGGTGGAGGAGAPGRNGSIDPFDLGGATGGTGGLGGLGGTGGAGGAGGAGAGGGVLARGYSVFMIDSTLANNQSLGGTGGAGGVGGVGGAGGRGGDGNIEAGNGGHGSNGGTGGSGGSAGASSGAGLERVAGLVLVINSTIAYNQASSAAGGAGGTGGGKGPGGPGGAALNGPKDGTAGEAGVAGASGAGSTTGIASGGGLAAGPTQSSIVGLINSIVARNLAAGAASDLSGSVDSTSNNNLIGTGGAGGLTNGTYGNLVGISNPGLGTLANNGGPTQTIALLRGSPAVNAGDNTLALDYLFQPLTTDQRGTGFARIIGPTVDIGAVESIFGPESLVVTTLVDEDDGTSTPTSGTGTSLREAIDWANLNPGGDTITFAPALAGGIITLGGTQLPVITENLQIGNGLYTPTISGNHTSRVLEIAAGAQLTLAQVSVANGNADFGAGIYNRGTLVLQANKLSGNTASQSGGGIYNTGTATLYINTLTGNTATQSGGGIYNTGTLTLISSPFSGFNTLSTNTASQSGGGIYNSGTLTMTDSKLIGNSALSGGGLFNVGTSGVTNSTFSGNHAEGSVNSEGGGIYNNATMTVTTSTFSGNTTSGTGGGIDNDGTLTVTNSTLSGNSTAFYGAGISSTGPLTITNSTLSGNSAGFDGGAIKSSGVLTITNSTLSGNSAGSEGGAIWNFSTATLINSTLTRNSAADSGGGIYNLNGTLTLTNSTLAGNRADADGNNSGTGGGIWTFSSGAFTRLSNSIVAGNVRGIVSGDVPNDFAGRALTTDSSFNLVGIVSNSGGLINGVNGNLVGVDPKLGALANNGGSTQTLALLPFSPALNAGSNALIPDGITADGRGGSFTRIRGGNVDIGAYEVQGNAPTISQNRTSAAGDEGASVLIPNVFGDYGNSGLFTDDLGISNVTVTASLGSITRNESLGAWYWTYIPTDSGSSTIIITATDSYGMKATVSFPLTVGNVAPTATITDVPVSGHSPEGTALTLGSSIFDPSSVDTAAGFTYAWSVTKNGVAFASGTTAGISFTPDDQGAYAVSLTATDKDGGVSPVASTTIFVDNVAPTASITGLPVSGHSPEGAAITLGSSVSDPSSVDTAAGFTLAWSITKNGFAFASGTTADISFTPNDDGSYVVSLIATGGDGVASPMASTTILVDNVAPTVVIGGASSVNAGATYTLTLGAISDLGADTVSNYIVNWGDGRTDVYTSAGAKTHIYSSSALPRAITVDLVDEDGTHINRANALTVTVNTVPLQPTVTVPASQTAYENVDKLIRGIVVAGANGRKLTVTLTVASGKLSLGPTTGLTVTGNKSRSVTLSGLASSINSALMALTYRANSNFFGQDDLNVCVSDSGLSSTASIAISTTSAVQQAADLRAQVTALKAAGTLTNTQATLLASFLDIRNNSQDAGRINNFLQTVENYRLSGILSQVQANALLNAGNNLLLSVTQR